MKTTLIKEKIGYKSMRVDQTKPSLKKCMTLKLCIPKLLKTKLGKSLWGKVTKEWYLIKPRHSLANKSAQV